MTKPKLELSLPSEREIRITRSFDAPRSLVWDCHTRPALVRLWMLGPPGWEMPVCTIDLRVGGGYRYEWHEKARGMKMGLSGTFTEVVAPERLGAREIFDDDWTGGETLVSQVLTERNATTTLVTTILYGSREARDRAAATGMADGMEMSYIRLDEVLARR